MDWLVNGVCSGKKNTHDRCGISIVIKFSLHKENQIYDINNLKWYVSCGGGWYPRTILSRTKAIQEIVRLERKRDYSAEQCRWMSCSHPITLLEVRIIRISRELLKSEGTLLPHGKSYTPPLKITTIISNHY